MKNRVFVDTNIFIYARDKSDKRKQEIASNTIIELWNSRSLVISTQVVTEFCSVLSKKLKIDDELIKEEVNTLLALDPLPLNNDIIKNGLEIKQQYNLSYWDSWIIAAALISGCETIISEDLSNGASYHGVIIKNPF
jgi:predicted nucleic acid-binding protein